MHPAGLGRNSNLNSIPNGTAASICTRLIPTCYGWQCRTIPTSTHPIPTPHSYDFMCVLHHYHYSPIPHQFYIYLQAYSLTIGNFAEALAHTHSHRRLQITIFRHFLLGLRSVGFSRDYDLTHPVGRLGSSEVGPAL